MKLVRTVAEVRAELAQARRMGKNVGLVPTMGALHEGHLSLIRRARAQSGFVVVSLFVNPTQFNDPSDLAAYPREEQADAARAEHEGADLLFVPAATQLYPEEFATHITVSGIGEALEGAHRGPGHFQGVATVVVKLLNIVAPERAYFGQKDAQQAAVIRRVVRDLNLPVGIEVCPTVRAPDGLALSSRNGRLSPADRARATGLYRALRAAEAAVHNGQRDPGAVVAAARAQLTACAIEPEYLELVDPHTFQPVEQLRGAVLALVAASFHGTRLIDNHMIHVPAATAAGAPATIAADGELPARSAA